MALPSPVAVFKQLRSTLRVRLYRAISQLTNTNGHKL